MVALRFARKVFLRLILFLVVVGIVSAAEILVGSGSNCVHVQTISASPATTTPPYADRIFALSNYRRDEQITFLRFPEWYIVYSAREYSAYLNASGTPSTFPYQDATAQFWCSYGIIKNHVDTKYPNDSWWHTVLIVIGSSFAAEDTIQQGYEITIGNLSLMGGGADTPEDGVEREVAAEYAKSLDTVPWYYYPFFTAVKRVWAAPLVGPHMWRKWERRIALTVGYGVKGTYGILMAKANGDNGTYAETELSEMLTVQMPFPQQYEKDARIKVIKDFGNGVGVIEVPRYQEFTDLMREFATFGVKIIDIAGNSNMLISFFAPKDWKYNLPGKEFFAMPISTDKDTLRVVAVVPNSRLLDTIRQIIKEKLTFEHVYDY